MVASAFGFVVRDPILFPAAVRVGVDVDGEMRGGWRLGCFGEAGEGCLGVLGGSGNVA